MRERGPISLGAAEEGRWYHIAIVGEKGQWEGVARLEEKVSAAKDEWGRDNMYAGRPHILTQGKNRRFHQHPGEQYLVLLGETEEP